jgi:predicted amidophosphoribosyltransferase
MRAAFRLVLDFGLPQLCPSCRGPLSEGEGLCAACWSKLSLIEPPYCVRLGIPFAYDPGPGLLSMEAIANPPAYDRARAVVRYDDVARTLVHGLKYTDRLDLSPMMGRWMARAGRELLADADALVPVPLHWRRRWARRFNQSAALAGSISAFCDVPVAYSGLKRVRAASTGRTIEDRAGRQRSGSFRGPGRTPGRHRRQTPGADRRRAYIRRYG